MHIQNTIYNILHTTYIMRLLGIDYGEKRIGVALSDEGGSLAFPYGIFKNDSAVIKRIQTLCAAEHVRGIVIGASYNYGGKENPIMKKIRAFKKTIERTTGLPTFFELEMLTSQEAKRSREEGSDAPVDDSAAALILQSFLDKKKYGPH